MSTEVTNVEDPTPETPAPEAQATEQPPPDPQEAEAVEVGGEKMVPLSVLLETRREAKALKEAAARGQAAEQYAAQAKPYMDFLAANPHILQQGSNTPAPAGVDPEVEALARELDLYTPKGELDTARASKIIDRQQRIAQQAAAAAVQPVKQSAAQQQSAANFQRAAAVKLPDGSTVDPNALAQVWAGMPAELSADPQVATVLLAVAAGASRFNGRQTVQPPGRPPLFTEDTGGGPRAKPTLTALDKRVIAARGMKEDDYAKATATFVKGRTNIIEDD